MSYEADRAYKENEAQIDLMRMREPHRSAFTNDPVNREGLDKAIARESREDRDTIRSLEAALREVRGFLRKVDDFGKLSGGQLATKYNCDPVEGYEWLAKQGRALAVKIGRNEPSAAE